MQYFTVNTIKIHVNYLENFNYGENRENGALIQLWEGDNAWLKEKNELQRKDKQCDYTTKINKTKPQQNQDRSQVTR